MQIFLIIFTVLISIIYLCCPIVVIVLIISLRKKKKRNKQLEENKNQIQYHHINYTTKVYDVISDEEKGEYGELKVKNVLDSELNDGEHKEIHNYMCYDENKYSHQIDHIVIHKNGIFCIETKNYSGYLLGNRNEEYWTQCLNGNSKIQIKNPLNQNYGHVRQLNRILKYKYAIKSLVVLVKNNADSIDAPNVINLDDLVNYITNNKENKTLSNDEINKIYDILLNSKINISNKEHIDNLKNRGIVVDD